MLFAIDRATGADAICFVAQPAQLQGVRGITGLVPEDFDGQLFKLMLLVGIQVVEQPFQCGLSLTQGMRNGFTAQVRQIQGHAATVCARVFGDKCCFQQA